MRDDAPDALAGLAVAACIAVMVVWMAGFS